MDVAIATLQCHVISRVNRLALKRLKQAKKQKDENEKAITITHQRLSPVKLPRDVVSYIIREIGNTIPSADQKAHWFDDPEVSVGADDWKTHRVYPSIPVTLCIRTDTGENSLRKMLSCKGINLSVFVTSSPYRPILEKSLTVLLEYPSKWRSLEFSTNNKELVPFLVRCSPTVPYLTYLSIYMCGGLYDKQVDLTPISQSIRRDSIKLKEACFTSTRTSEFNSYDNYRKPRVDLTR